MSSFAPTTTCGEHPPGRNGAVVADLEAERSGKRQRSGSFQALNSLPLPHRRRPGLRLPAENKELIGLQRSGSKRQEPRFSPNRCRMESTGVAFGPPKVHPGRAIRRVKCTREGDLEDQSAPGSGLETSNPDRRSEAQNSCRRIASAGRSSLSSSSNIPTQISARPRPATSSDHATQS